MLTGSTPLYDLPNGRIIKPEPGQPLVVPEGAVVVPGARSVSVGAGKEWGLSLATPVIVKYRDDKTDTRTELEAVDPVDVVGLTRTLIDIESTTGQEGAVGRVLAGYLRERGYSVLEQPLDGGRINVIAAVGEPERGVLHALRLRAAVLPEPRRGRRAARPRRLRRQGHPGRAGGGG